MDRIVKTASFKIRDYEGMYSESTLNITLYQRAKGWFSSSKTDYYMTFTGMPLTYPKGHDKYDLKENAEYKFDMVCFYWFRVEVKQSYLYSITPTYEVWGLNQGDFQNGMSYCNFKFNPTLKTFSGYLVFSGTREDRLEWYARIFSEVSGHHLSPDDMRNIYLLVTNDSVTMLKSDNYIDEPHSETEICKLKNCTAFILKVLTTELPYDLWSYRFPRF